MRKSRKFSFKELRLSKFGQIFFFIYYQINQNISKTKLQTSIKMSSKEAKDKENNEKLIKIAVQFLLNPKIENAPDETKKSFLKKKGSLFSSCHYQRLC